MCDSDPRGRHLPDIPGLLEPTAALFRSTTLPRGGLGRLQGRRAPRRNSPPVLVTDGLSPFTTLTKPSVPPFPFFIAPEKNQGKPPRLQPHQCCGRRDLKSNSNAGRSCRKVSLCDWVPSARKAEQRCQYPGARSVPAEGTGSREAASEAREIWG